MQEIKTSVIAHGDICAETIAPGAAMVVFGASGNLARQKLLVSVFGLFSRGLLSDRFYLVGAGRKAYSDETFRQEVVTILSEYFGDAEQEKLAAFAKRLYYVSGDYGEQDFYRRIAQRLAQLDKSYRMNECRIFYLAVPPFLYTQIVKQLGLSGLSGPTHGLREPPRIVVEKPFGRDLKSASQLNGELCLHFTESQVYRIDHYLGKDTVQNIMMFRFANTIFEPVWNRNYIDHVQITIAESVGIGQRGSYYDRTGALRDMFQNHMLQMLALAGMEPPGSFDAESIRDEKVKLLRSIRPLSLEPWQEGIVRGQYGPGVVDGTDVPGYLEEADIEPGSRTETYVAAKLFIDNWRWKDVPFYLRTGKRLKCKDTEIAIIFKKVPHSMFALAGIGEVAPNTLLLQIQPHESISLSFQAKQPGSKLCMNTLRMVFSYSHEPGWASGDAYQRLLLDCMLGDQTLFTRQDDVDVTWKLVEPVLKVWEKDESIPQQYPAGCESFEAADRLIESDGRSWREISQ